MIYLIISYIIVVLVILPRKDKSFKDFTEFLGVAKYIDIMAVIAFSFILSFILGSCHTLYICSTQELETVKQEIVEVNNTLFTEEDSNNAEVSFYVKDNDSLEKETVYGKVEKVEYKGSKAYVEYEQPVKKEYSALETVLFFPNTLDFVTNNYSTDITVVLPESEK